MLFGARTFRDSTEHLGATPDADLDPINSGMKHPPTTVLSTTLEELLDWPDATVVRGDPVEVVGRLERESDVPVRSHGSRSVNRALMAAGLVDRVQVTSFPVISGRTGTEPVFAGAADVARPCTEGPLRAQTRATDEVRRPTRSTTGQPLHP